LNFLKHEAWTHGTWAPDGAVMMMLESLIAFVDEVK
jgi:hypothetical protein